MTDCIVKWDGGSETIKDTELGDPRVGALLDRLAKQGAKRPSVEFVEDFLDGNLACNEFVTDPSSACCLECGYLFRDHVRAGSAGEKS